MQDDQAHNSGSDGGEGFVDEEDDEIGSPEDVASPLEKLKQKLRKLCATKNEHDMAYWMRFVTRAKRQKNSLGM